ncbi:MAG: RagB/SusD family nutrient uptake outer membrane protein [Cyclobacteriaceae bacterium]
MKYIRYIAVALIGVVPLAGCNDDLLDKAPITTLNPSTFWTSEDDAILAVNALYAYLPGYEAISFDKYSDIAVSSSIGGNDYIRGQTSSTEPMFENDWNRGYDAVRAANYLLENIELISDMNADLKSRIIGEARFIRALRYTYLVAHFGDVPFFEKTMTPEEAATIGLTDKELIWDFIDAELSDIASDLPVSYDEPERERITHGAALAFHARAMLYAGRFAKARDAAKAVIDLNVYELHDNYAELFQYVGENNKEVILQRGYAQNILPTNYPDQGPKAGFNGAGRTSVTRTLVDEYETSTGKSITAGDTDWDYFDPYKNRDPRLQATVWLPVFGSGTYSDFRLNTSIPFDTRPGQSGDSPDYVNGSNVATTTGFMVKKYLDPLDASNKDNGGINFINIRYADVLLMYAEAKIELGEIDATVVDAINEVRQRASVNLPAIGSGDQATMRAQVRHERMVELAMEGLRFYDIRRWKTALDIMQGPIPGMVYLPLGNESAGPDTIVWEATVRTYAEADYEFPIPFRETQINPNLIK